MIYLTCLVVLLLNVAMSKNQIHLSSKLNRLYCNVGGINLLSLKMLSLPPSVNCKDCYFVSVCVKANYCEKKTKKGVGG